MTAHVPDPLRASDADRQQTENLLEQAFTDGRLSHDELLERTQVAWQATYRSELDLLTNDIGIRDARSLVPTGSYPPATRNEITGQSGPPMSLAIMGGTDRGGRWTCPERHVTTAVMGGVTIDLREADFEAEHTTIVVIAVMGGVDVIVPPDLDYEVDGFALMGGFGQSAKGRSPRPRPGAPKVKITGFALMGGAGVEIKEIGAR